MLNPTHDRRVRQGESTFGHHLHEITKAEFVAQIPAHAEDDYFAIEMAAFEEFVHVEHSSALSFEQSAGKLCGVNPVRTRAKIKGRWTYLYRAVDKEGRTVDFLLRAKRDVAAAKAFFRLAFRRQGRLPLKITLDGYQASHRAAKEALDEHPEGNQCKIRSSKYLNNLIEQDHRSVKFRLGPMLGLKHFRQAATTIAGIELMHRIRKGQFKLGRLGAKGNTAPKIWNAVLAA